MVMNVYSVFDSVAGVFSRPYFLNNDNLAVRAFGDAVADKSTGLYVHVDDYKLYKIGVFDDISGQLVACDTPQFISNASDFKSLIKEGFNESSKS